MTSSLAEQIDKLQRAIRTLESQRTVLGDAVVQASIEAIKKQLAGLEGSKEQVAQQRKLATILFSDIVGHTQLIHSLDPEDNMEIIEGALVRLAKVIEAHGGHIARFQGDGFKAIFGVPTAEESDPEKAVRAGLGIVAAAQEYARTLEAERNLSGFRVRVGIDTGLVVTGGATEAEDTIKGLAVNLAARLESAAPPGGVLISYHTYQHVRGVFDVEPQEPIQAKGFAEPVLVYLVKRAKPRAFRKGRRGVAGIETRMIGREAELRTLQDAFYTALEDQQLQMVTVVSEAGLGKSRLLYEFDNWTELQPQPFRVFQARAGRQSQGLPYFLIRDLLANRFQIADSDPAAIVREKLVTGVAGFMGEDSEEKAHVIGQMLGYSLADSPDLHDILDDPRQLRRRGVAYLIQFFTAVSQERPVQIFLEDIHWADEASLNVVQQLAQGCQEQQIWLICLARPALYERRPLWGEGQLWHLRLDLHPLSKRNSRRLADEILKKVAELPPALRDLIVDNAEGNPYYVEELIKMMIEEGNILTETEQWQVDPMALAEVRVPPTLTGILQARLDRLPDPEHRVLQCASVLGRIFWDEAVRHLQLTAQVPDDPSATPETTLDSLKALRGSELIFRRETSAFADTEEFIFKHMLLRDVTYESVLKSHRRLYHRQAAEWLIQQSGERVNEYAGLIADHFERAGEVAQAITFLHIAGNRARRMSAYEEAIRHLTQGLALLETLPETPDRPQQELSLQYALGNALFASKGPTAPEVGQAYARAWELCRQVRETPELFPVLYGVWVFYLTRGELQITYELGEEWLRRAQRQQEPAPLLMGYRVLGVRSLYFGELTAAQERFEQCIAIYDSQDHSSLAVRYGLDPGVNARILLAMDLWLLGYPDQALQRGGEALTLAEELSHPHSQAFALVHAMFLHQLRQERQLVQERAEAGTTLSSKHGFPFWLAYGTVLSGWALAMQAEQLDRQGNRQEGITRIRQGLATIQAMEAKIYKPYVLGLLAEVHCQAGQAEEGLKLLTGALETINDTGERWYEAEVYRLQGDLLLMQGETEGDPTATLRTSVEASYRQAIEVARGQSAKSWQLRATVSLARLWQSQGKQSEAHQMLAEIYDWFSEGFDTMDLLEARTLLEELL